MNGVSNEILILIKSKNINVFGFQIITNQTNHNYFCNETNNITKKISIFLFFLIV